MGHQNHWRAWIFSEIRLKTLVFVTENTDHTPDVMVLSIGNDASLCEHEASAACFQGKIESAARWTTVVENLNSCTRRKGAVKFGKRKEGSFRRRIRGKLPSS
jgi:hypothetical protein